MSDKPTEGKNEVICPACGDVMQSGYLAGGGYGLAFYPGEKKNNLVASLRMIRSFTKGKCIAKRMGTLASCCQNCRRITFEY